MHKQLFNEAVLELGIRANGPLLIKAGETGGLDPTRPDMEWVRTNDQVVIPGSSLKGVLRAHSERIIRSLQAGNADGRGACDPLKRGESCSDRLERQQLDGHAVYQQSCFVCRLFGNTSVASRVRFADALPTTRQQSDAQLSNTQRTDEIKIEERNGVAIDRVYGSVAVGPFNYEVVARGVFRTRILFKNFTLAQLAVVGLALRDLGEGRIGIGFGKSRGLGRVAVDWGQLTIRYPLANLRREQPPADTLLGAGELAGTAARNLYGLPHNDRIALPGGARFERDEWSGFQLVAEGQDNVQAIFRAAVDRLRVEVEHE